MKYLEYTVLTTTEASDAVAYLLEEKGALGIAIEDPNDFFALNKDKCSWDYADPSLTSALGTDVKVKGYFRDYVDKLEESIAELVNYGLNIGKGQLVVSQIDEEDWANSWKKYFKPFRVGHRIVIKPTWEKYCGDSNDLIIEIDPGMAFGTGDHETTYLCLELIERYVKPEDKVVDVGCGSGILGIAAAKLGADSVFCIDIDENACKVARENVNLNNAKSSIAVIKGNLLDTIKEKSDLIIANIIADAIITLADQAFILLNPGGLFISSGIIIDRKDDVIDSLNRNDFRIIEVLEKGEWCAIVAKR